VAKEFLAQVVARAQTKDLTSDEHFTGDRTLLEAWAGTKKFSAEGRKDPASTVRSWQPRREFSQGEAVASHHRSPIPIANWPAKVRARGQVEFQRESCWWRTGTD